MLSLRELVYFGFCGMRPTAPAQDNLGYVHHVLDIATRAKGEGVSDFSVETNRVQLASNYSVPYAHMPYLYRRLEAIHEHREILARYRRNRFAAYWGVKPNLREIVVDLFEAEDGSLLEPSYDFIERDLAVPLYAIVGAFLAGVPCDKPVTVRTLSMVGDLDVTASYPLKTDQIRALLDSACATSATPGPQCLSCPLTECSFQSPFDAAMYEYLKLKQKLDQAETALREHLTVHGPTKVGFHIAHMKERVRRTYSEKKGGGLLDELLTFPNWVRYVRPDARTILKAIDKKDLPERMADMFTESRYWTLETALDTWGS